MEIVDVNRLTIGTKACLMCNHSLSKLMGIHTQVLESFDTHTIAMIGRAISEKVCQL